MKVVLTRADNSRRHVCGACDPLTLVERYLGELEGEPAAV